VEERTASAVLGSVFSNVPGASSNIRPKSNAHVRQQNRIVDVPSDLVVLTLLCRVDHSVVADGSRWIWLWSRGDWDGSGGGSGNGCCDRCEG